MVLKPWINHPLLSKPLPKPCLCCHLQLPGPSLVNFLQGPTLTLLEELGCTCDGWTATKRVCIYIYIFAELYTYMIICIHRTTYTFIYIDICILYFYSYLYLNLQIYIYIYNIHVYLSLEPNWLFLEGLTWIMDQIFQTMGLLDLESMKSQPYFPWNPGCL